ncbi:MAG: hypothetical protein ACYCZB_10505 [Acidiphilium sp.]
MPFDSTTSATGFPPAGGRVEIKRFASAERAWLWAACCLAARRAGRAMPSDPSRPCTPEVILRALDRLYRAGRIDLVHARVLRAWGDRGRAPNPRVGGDRNDWRQWRHALGELEQELRTLGIVAGFDLAAPSPPREKFLPDDRITFLFSMPSPTRTKEI